MLIASAATRGAGAGVDHADGSLNSASADGYASEFRIVLPRGGASLIKSGEDI
jgi:hypothetical protein